MWPGYPFHWSALKGASSSGFYGWSFRGLRVGVIAWPLPGGRDRLGMLCGAAALAAVLLACLLWFGVPGAPLFSTGAHGVPRLAAHPGPSLLRLPSGLQAAASSALGAEAKRFAITRAGGRGLVASGGGLSTRFGRSGPVMHAGGSRLALSLVGVGHGSELSAATAASPIAVGNRAVYRRGGVVEWYRNGPLGLEQGFTLRGRPTGRAGWLTISVRAAGGLRVVRAGSGLVFVRGRGGAAVVRYGGLSAVDAQGRSMPARIELRGSAVLLRVDDAHAAYPLRIDPFVQQGPKLVGTGFGSEGVSAALSDDGSTALIGGTFGASGAGAWVFTRSGSSWSQQGPKLVGTGGANGLIEDGFSVALSGDGNTALVGGPYDNHNVGAAWVFTRSGSTWSQEGPKLIGSGATGAALQGVSVALSADGSTALIGGIDDNNNTGAAWVFTRSGSTWSQQGSKLVGSGAVGAASEGRGVALSSDGSTALIGGPADNGYKGAAWVFTRSGSSWSQQGPKLVGTGASSGDTEQGWSVALSHDGSHRACWRPGGRLAQGGGVGVRPLGIDLVPARLEARRCERAPW